MRQAVIFIHGIGSQGPGFSTPLEEAIREQLSSLLGDVPEPDLIYKEAVWAHVLSGYQQDLWRRVRRGNGKKELDMVKLRRFMIHFLGDAITYQNDDIGEDIYGEIHQVITDTLQAVRNEAGQDPIELTFVAHSLGSVILSNWLWDNRPADEGGQSGLSVKATNLFTLGSPIALWLLRFGNVAEAGRVVTVGSNGAWVNILDDEDIIAYPLRPINDAYKQAVDLDYITETGGILSAGNPLSHTGYWDDRNVYKPIAKKLALDHQRIVDGKPYSKRAYLRYINSLWNF